MRNTYKILITKLKGKGLLEKPKCRWNSNIRMDLGEMGLEVVDWMHQAQYNNWWWLLLKW
jgi:hypothetical protein